MSCRATRPTRDGGGAAAFWLICRSWTPQGGEFAYMVRDAEGRLDFVETAEQAAKLACRNRKAEVNP